MKLVVAGDFSPKYKAKDFKLYNKDCFSDVTPLILGADYSVVNLECPITDNHSNKLIKFGPNLSNPTEAVSLLKDIGFRCATLANNHIFDFSSNGLCDTIDCLQRNHLDYVGVGQNIFDAQKVLYKNVNGEKIAIINCCESEYTVATYSDMGANPLDVISQFYAINEAKKQAKYVLVIVHGGIEHYQLPTPRMKKNFRFFIDCGADCVINHHQHCYSGFEKYKEGLIFYGLGNFYFDTIHPDHRWSQGFLLELDLDNHIKFNLYPYVQCYNNIGVRLMNDSETDEFYKKITNLNDIIQSDKELFESFEKFSDAHESDYGEVFSPYSGRLLNYLYRKGFLPGIMSNRKWLFLKDMFTCESHYDRFLHMINNKLK